MPPRKGERRQPARQSAAQGHISEDAIARRVKRYLDELQRVNYHTSGALDADGESAADRERLAVSLESKSRGKPGKRSTMGVRNLLLYRKNLNTLIEESGLKDLPGSPPNYLTAAAPPPLEPPLRFCVGCGYWGKYHCEKCGDDYCSIKCKEWHTEYRCGKL